ncbi:glycosyltransferase [Kocuria tytonicola]|uniref:Glycosyltransferase n=1 Tax=Kocuria tytonicola TaxID=2055946 RepID=A0A3L9L7S8_9MICC|nr:glycosyltransferase [Kocuria tytonicola]RLY92442.1 glycosyltransferase [Kocuria tytonicola]RLZ03831.1 glycosyltransferase [Kocuria tytonicola]
MRVLHIVNDAETGGAQTLIEQLLLTRRPEDEAHLLVLLGPGALSPRLEAAATSTTYAHMTRRDLLPVRAARAVRRLVREHRIDVVHSHLQQSDLVNELTPHGAAKVTTLHSSLNLASSRVAGVVWRLAAVFSSRLDAVVACSPTARDFAVDFGYRFPGERILVVPNGTTTAAAPAPEPPGDPVLLHLGRRVPAKDHPTLFRAFAQTRERHPLARLVCAGHGVDPHNRVLTDELARLGLTDAVELLGSVSDVRSLIRASHAMVFSSSEEALPMAGIEALSEGVPVITTDTGDTRVLSVEPFTLVPPRDPEALGAALTRFLDLTPTLREGLRHRSWERARADFDARVTARRYRELYEELTTAS